jgi:hypothetical protein
MGETSDQIAREIDRRRAALGRDLEVLEGRVKRFADWRFQFQKRPLLMTGLAFGGGVLLSRFLLVSSSRDRR